MSSQLTPFTFPETSREIRVVEIDGEPWFVGSDLAAVLDYDDARNALRSVRDRNKGRQNVTTPGGQQECLCVNEPGLYELIIKSRSPRAEAFQDWVYEEVLPQIRKTGAYAAELTPAQRLLQQAQLLVEQERRQMELERQQRQLEREQIETRLQVLEQASRIDAQQQAISRHDAQLASLNHRDGYLTILAWWRLRGIPGLLTVQASQQMGKTATAKYREMYGCEPPRVPDGRFGYANQYPEDILDYLFLNPTPQQ